MLASCNMVNAFVRNSLTVGFLFTRFFLPAADARTNC